MAKTFRDWNLDQGMLLPPSVRDFVPEGHLAHFIRDLVSQELDLSAILGVYTEEKGYPPYPPHPDDGPAALQLLPGALFLPADCQGLRGAHRLQGGHRPESTRLPHRQ